MKARKGKVNWKQVVIGRVPGVLLGARGVFSDSLENGEIEVADGHQPGTVSDELSFGDAFAAARAEIGPGGVFEWKGNLYATDTVEEWNASHPREEYPDEILAEQEEPIAADIDAEENEVVIFGESEAEEVSEVMMIDIDDNGNDDAAVVADMGDGADASFMDAEAYGTDVMDDGFSDDII